MTAAAPSGTSSLIGISPAIQSLRTFIPKVAVRECNVLITGETGTGKERVAEAIHACSPRAQNKLVSVNCAAVPDSLLESELFGHEKGAFTGAHARFHGRLREADSGTIFLDEIGDMSLLSQAKILRAIDQKEIYRVGGREPERLDIRVVAATNQNLADLAATRRFRSDLYYRLNVVNIHLPPLRERTQDVEPLFRHFVRKLLPANELGPQLSEQAWLRLSQYDWPGNVRELRNLVEWLLIDPDRRNIAPADLPAHMQLCRHKVTQSERDRLLAVLGATQWNRSRAARQLQCSRMTLYRKMLKYDIVQSCSTPPLDHGEHVRP